MQATGPHDKLWHIKNCPLFTAMSPEEQHAIESASQMVELGRNKLVPSSPDDEPSLFVVKKGHVHLTYTDDSGAEAVVILLGPGDIFGTLDPDERSFGEHCRTVSEACICRISRSRFEAMMRKYPDLAFRLTKFSLLRINRLQVRLAEMMMRPAPQRLALALLDLDSQIGRDDPTGGRKLTLALTHADLAKLIGTSREMVTILFSRLRKAGIIESRKGWIHLLDLEGLRSVAEGAKL